MIKTSLRARLITNFIALAIGPLLVVGLIIIWQSFAVQREQALAIQYEIARRASLHIEGFLRHLEDELELIASLEGLLNFSSEHQRQLLSHVLTHQYEDYGTVFDRLTLYDAAGRTRVHVSRLSDDTVSPGRSVRAAPELVDTVTGGATYFGTIRFAPQSNEPLMTVAVPIEDLQSGAVTSILEAEIRLKMMWDTVRNIEAGRTGIVYIVDAADRLVAHPNPSEVLRNRHFPPPARDGIQQGLNGNTVILTTQMLALGRQQLHVVTEIPIAEALAATRTTLAVIVALMFVVLFTAIELGIVLIRKIVQPLETLAGTARAIEGGDLSQRVNIRREDEIGALSDAFNAMADRLQHTIRSLEIHSGELEQTSDALREIGQALNQSLQKEKELHEMKSRFVSVVSHEFRTPLTSIRSSTEILETYADRLSPDKQRQHLRRIRTNVDAMTRLLGDVTFIGHIDSGKRALTPTEIDLQQFCAELVEETLQMYPGPATITQDIHDGCRLRMDDQILRHILSNLLSNAVKYSPDGGAVDLVTRCQSGMMTVTVRDHGIGIPDGDQALLFEAFHRAENVGNISGSGLGLSIVKRCVDLYHGDMRVTSHEGRGTTVVVTLPGTCHHSPGANQCEKKY